MTQSDALAILKLGKNIFLTGAPGSGKTYLLNQYISFLQSKDVHAAITAYTGIAASHLNGGTLHSWAGLNRANGPVEPAAERERIRANKYLVGRVTSAKVLIIDEISMLHPEEFDRVDFICKTARNSGEPFGGLQLICCGDFFQIPPVSRGGAEGRAAGAGQFVIDSDAWKNADMVTCYLTEQHRQGDENVSGGLLTILREIREGRVSPRSIALLEGRLGARVDAPVGIARLYTHNENVNEINDAELRELAGDPVVYDVHENGNARRVEKLRNDYKVDKLVLKIGARVMFTRNNMGAGYVNGTLGEVVGFEDMGAGAGAGASGGGVAAGDPVVRTFDGRELVAEREAWELEEDGKVVASVRQVPLKLAWAITVHKSQGMTLDAAEINLGRAFDKGMGYVALSRVRKLENISLIAFNKMSLEVSERIKVLDKEFLAESAQSEAMLAGLTPAEQKKMQKDFLGTASETGNAARGERATIPPEGAISIAYGGESEETLDELPVIDFE
jgi:hypothetical protein